MTKEEAFQMSLMAMNRDCESPNVVSFAQRMLIAEKRAYYQEGFIEGVQTVMSYLSERDANKEIEEYINDKE